MNFKEQWNYLKHIMKLMGHSAEDRRFYTFCAIGILGTFVNLLSLTICLSLLNMEEISASINSSCIAMFHNFLWNDKVTWKGNKQQILRKRVLQFCQFALISSLGIAITTLSTQTFLFLGWSVYVGQLTGIALSTFWNFSANRKWTWSAAQLINPEEEKLIVTQEIPSKISWN